MAAEDKEVNMETGADGCEFMRILEGNAYQTQEGLPKNADMAKVSVNMEVGGDQNRDPLVVTSALCILVLLKNLSQPLSA